MSLEDITPEVQKKMGIVEKTGVIVVDVAKGSAADEAGIEAGDIVKEVNRAPGKEACRVPGPSVAKARKGATVLAPR